jgi:hypothetical protein
MNSMTSRGKELGTLLTNWTKWNRAKAVWHGKQDWIVLGHCTTL